MLNKIIVGAALVSLSTFVSAGKTSNAEIDRMMIDEAYGGLIFIRVDGATENMPECSTNGTWQYVLSLDTELQRETMTSFLLSAYIAGKKVQLIGKDVCDKFGSIETLKRIEFESQ